MQPVKPKGKAPQSDLSVCMLASGSKGNSVYVSGGQTAILVDAGLSGVQLERRMRSRGLDPESLDGIVVSHEHHDHIHGVGVMARRYRLPVYASRPTARAAGKLWGRIELLNYFQCGTAFELDDLSVRPFSLSHDAVDTAGFTIRRNGTKVGIATDLGIATSVVREHLKHCSALVLEANHDPEMLINGPYPWHLKQRIKGRGGHLSNLDSRRLVQGLIHERLRHVILAHLSEQNNTPEKALRAVSAAASGRRLRFSVARQDRSSHIWHF